MIDPQDACQGTVKVMDCPDMTLAVDHESKALN